MAYNSEYSDINPSRKIQLARHNRYSYDDNRPFWAHDKTKYYNRNVDYYDNGDYDNIKFDYKMNTFDGQLAKDQKITPFDLSSGRTTNSYMNGANKNSYKNDNNSYMNDKTTSAKKSGYWDSECWGDSPMKRELFDIVPQQYTYVRDPGMPKDRKTPPLFPDYNIPIDFGDNMRDGDLNDPFGDDIQVSNQTKKRNFDQRYYPVNNRNQYDTVEITGAGDITTCSGKVYAKDDMSLKQIRRVLKTKPKPRQGILAPQKLFESTNNLADLIVKKIKNMKLGNGNSTQCANVSTKLYPAKVRHDDDFDVRSSVSFTSASKDKMHDGHWQNLTIAYKFVDESQARRNLSIVNRYADVVPSDFDQDNMFSNIDEEISISIDPRMDIAKSYSLPLWNSQDFFDVRKNNNYRNNPNART